MSYCLRFKIYGNDVSVSHTSEGHGHGHETLRHSTTSSSGHGDEHKGISLVKNRRELF